MKKLFLSVLLLSFIFSYSQKYNYNTCELMDNNGDLIYKWEDDSYIQIFDDYLIFGSENHKLLDILSPSSLFDMSDYRLFIQTTPSVFMEGDSGKILKQSIFEDANFPSKVGILTDSLYNFFMFAPSNNLTLAVFNRRKKPTKNR